MAWSAAKERAYVHKRAAHDRAMGFAVFSGRRVSRDGFLGLGRRPEGTIVSVVERPAPRGTVWVMWDDSDNSVELWSLEAIRLE